MAKDLKKLSDDELVALNQKLGVESDAIRAQRHAVKYELDRRRAMEVLDQLPPGVRDVLIEGITAEAKIGEVVS